MKPTPAQQQLAARNREILAERMGWPSGTLATCIGLERKHPGWRVDWLGANDSKGFERPAGFVASREDVTLYGADDLGRERYPRVFSPERDILEAGIAIAEERIAEEEEMERRRREWMLGDPDRSP